MTPLLSALSSGRDAMATALLEAGADPKALCSKVRIPFAPPTDRLRGMPTACPAQCEQRFRLDEGRAQ